MRTTVLATALLLIASLAQAQLPTTTTLSQQTAVNTSAPATFTTQVDGNLGAGNISKLPIRSLLYPGSTTKIYAHVEPWWGSGSHINIGYSSQDPAQVHSQVQDMVSRGIDGAVVDWYGPGSYEDTGVKLLIKEAEATSGFNILVEIDVGAVNWHSCYPTCSATTAVINLFTAANTNFFSSPAIARLGTRPLLMEFGMETLTLPSGAAAGWNVVDWNAVQTQVPGNLALVHRNLSGYTKGPSTGAFVWMEPKTLSNFTTGFDDTADLNWFYSNSISTYPSMPAYGAVWKGFNDILASWAPSGGRHIDQNCGMTWLNTFASINKYYSATKQLPMLQLVTWNDYEEGSEVETGIDNCFSLSPALSGSTLQWTPTGNEATIDHYTVYASTDGQNLASLGDFVPGTHSLDLSTFTLAAGNYTVFVQAIGKPTIRNVMSAGVSYTVAAAAPTTPTTTTTTSTGPSRPARPQVIKVSATPSSQTVTSGATASYALTVAEEGATDPVQLSCSGLPAGSSCTFSTDTVTPDSTGTQVQMSVTTLAKTAQSNHDAPVMALLFSGLGLVGLAGRATRRKKMLGGALMLLVLMMTQIACGGGSLASSPSPTVQAPVTHTITVTAVSGTVVQSTIVSLTVN